jgi:hypothetical protein
VLSLEFSKGRVTAFLDEITKLKASDFPYQHSEQALVLIEQVFSGFLDRLENLDDESDPDTVRAACIAEVAGLFDYLPILGFILRSTNVRNAFEVYGPILRICKKVLGKNAKLLISSEWEYSPFTYARVTHLPNFVLIGLPAHESSNPLLLPLAGHELGHTIWMDRNIHSQFSRPIENEILSQITDSRWNEFRELHPEVKEKTEVTDDLIVRQTWWPAREWAARQIEETFCDMVGLRIFGESYCQAFAYLLAPGLRSARSVIYPNRRRRITNMSTAAKAYGVSTPPNFVDLFEDMTEPAEYERNKKFLLSLADYSSQCQTDAIIKLASEIVTNAGVTLPSKEKADDIYADLELIAPAQQAGCLANILNAGWRGFHDEELWSEIPQIKSRPNVLKELLLKSIEVLEYEEIINSP